MKNVSICRYHLAMFNRFRMAILFLMAFILVLYLVLIFLSGSSFLYRKDFAIASVSFFSATILAFKRLSYHARTFEEQIGVDIGKELIRSDEHDRTIKQLGERYWIYLFYYYPLANESYERFENIQESA